MTTKYLFRKSAKRILTVYVEALIVSTIKRRGVTVLIDYHQNILGIFFKEFLIGGNSFVLLTAKPLQCTALTVKPYIQSQNQMMLSNKSNVRKFEIFRTIAAR